MIIRPLLLRHGRLALPKSSPLRAYRRTVTTTASPTNPSAPTLEVRDPSHPVAQQWLFNHHLKTHTQDLGGVVEPHYKPHELLSNPPRPSDITLELLLASQAHIGHATQLWHPANAQYIFGVRGEADPIHIISLDTTAAYLRRACKIVHGVASKGGVILFVGTRAGQARTVVRAAQLAKGCHLFTKWIPGSITNGQQILGPCRKKVVDEKDEEVLGFEDQLVQKAAVKPDLVVCLNLLENYVLLHECGIHNIPTIGIVDTDVNPTWVTYPIPANDDSLRCVQVICGALGRAGEEGQAERLRRVRRGFVDSFPNHGLEPPTPGQAEKEKEAAERELLAQQYIEDEGEIVEEQLEGTEEDGMVERLAVADAEADEGVEQEVLDAGDEVDASLSQDQSAEASDNAQMESYSRDRPLSAEELAQAPADQGQGREIPDEELFRSEANDSVSEEELAQAPADQVSGREIPDEELFRRER